LPPTACIPFNDGRNDAFKLKYQELREQYTGSPIVPWNLFDVELISNLINEMDSGKAAGLDDLTSEHLTFSHPIVVCRPILTKLFTYYKCAYSGKFWRECYGAHS